MSLFDEEYEEDFFDYEDDEFDCDEDDEAEELEEIKQEIRRNQQKNDTFWLVAFVLFILGA